MNKYEQKAERIKQHLIDHPGDYQSVVSFFIAVSDSIAFEKRQQKNQKMAEIAKYRRGQK